MAAALDALFASLDRLTGRAPKEHLAQRLNELEVRPEDLASFMHFSDREYQHNLVRAGPWYNVWVICWKNGQRSPIHNHRGSSCAVRVLRGTLTESQFRFAPNGHVVPVGSQDHGPGEVISGADDYLHQVSNLQAGNADLVTLHVYSPPLLRMDTFSLSDGVRGEEVWDDEERKVVVAFPENSETPLCSVSSWVTPNRLFFVRNHFAEPQIDRDSWRLRVAGCVERPVEWTWDELTALPARSVFATVECAGNGRSFLKQKAAGVQWGAGAIGHAEWTGVPVKTVLEKSGLRPDALEVMFEGADLGSESDHPDPMHFARSLPLRKALEPDTLLVYRMNGEHLSPTHGYPVRLFVPGWYGVASVKWLQRMEVLDRPFGGYFQTVKYTIQAKTERGVETRIVGPMAVKSEIIRPQPGEVLGLGTNRLFGVAWAGEEPVSQVEVSTDDGRSWLSARLVGLSAPFSWTMWEYLWEVAEPGNYQLRARAVTASGHVQPVDHDSLCGGYMIRAVRPVSVRVEASHRRTTVLGDWDTLVYDMNAYAEENSRLPLDVELEFVEGEGI